MTWTRTLVAMTGVLLWAAVPARADILISPNAGVSMAGALDGSKLTYGGQLGFMGGAIGFELDYGYTTKTKGGYGGDNFRTIGGAVLFSPARFGSEKFRPYLAVGGGQIAAVSQVKHIVSSGDSESGGVLSAGGGVMTYMSNTFGLRFDARYMRAMLDVDEGASSPYFVRVTAGLIVRFK